MCVGLEISSTGERDPFPQLFIGISGKGQAIIADEDFDLQSRRTCYIPPTTVHQLRAEELVELI